MRVFVFQSTLARERATANPTKPVKVVSIHARARASDVQHHRRGRNWFQSTLARERATVRSSCPRATGFNPRSRGCERPVSANKWMKPVSIHARARASDATATGIRLFTFQSTLARERATSSVGASAIICFNPRSRASERRSCSCGNVCGVSIHARARASDRVYDNFDRILFQSTLARERATWPTRRPTLTSFNPRSRASERPPPALWLRLRRFNPRSRASERRPAPETMRALVSIHARARASDTPVEKYVSEDLFQSTLARERATAGA
mgnify:CR=1 FL=1